MEADRTSSVGRVKAINTKKANYTPVTSFLHRPGEAEPGQPQIRQVKTDAVQGEATF